MASNKEIMDQAQRFVEKLAEIMTEFSVNISDDGGGTGVYLNSSFVGYLEDNHDTLDIMLDDTPIVTTFKGD
tara:strand:- start:343 stop:558 length:216 start_codon:yes stop_codon:yes gene_type:complete